MMLRLVLIFLASVVATPTVAAKQKPAQSGVSITSSRPKVSLTSTLAEETVREDSNVYFTGAFANDGTVSITELSISAAPPDTVVCIRVLLSDGNATCDGSAKQNILPAEMKPGGKVAFCGLLKANGSHARRRIALVVHYADSKDKYTAVTYPGSLTVQDWWEHWGPRSYNFLKDFTFPIVLALFGLILKLMTDKRALRAETWSQMLPQSHRLAGKYYMPLTGAALGMSLEWKRYVDQSPQQTEAARQMFYYVMNFGRLMREVRLSIGGFYFKDRIGEQIASRCWKQIRDSYFPTTNEQERLDYFRAVRLVVEKQDVDLFLGILDAEKPESAFHKTWDLFSRVVADRSKMESMIAYLDVFRAIVVYESNRVYAQWYRLPETLQLDDIQEKLVDSLFDRETDKKQAKRYLKLSSRGQ